MKTLKDRQKLARKFKNSSHNKCKCCNMDVNLAKKKAAESQYDYYLILNNNFKNVQNIFENI